MWHQDGCPGSAEVRRDQDHLLAVGEAEHGHWAERLALDGAIVERAVERGEVPRGTDPGRVIEPVLGPIHLRLLLTGEPVDRAFLEGVVDVVVNGVARPR